MAKESVVAGDCGSIFIDVRVREHFAENSRTMGRSPQQDRITQLALLKTFAGPFAAGSVVRIGINQPRVVP